MTRFSTSRNVVVSFQLPLRHVLFFLLASHAVSGLVVSDRSQISKGRLMEALRSPAGKLTLSPELVIPEPTDPTAILLQSSLITALSMKMRTQAKANAILCSGSITALQTLCTEQESARGNFPSPLPLIYSSSLLSSGDDQMDEFLRSVAEAGATGIVIPVCQGKEVDSVSDLEDTTTKGWSTICQKALEYGLQPIPELFIGTTTAKRWQDEGVEATETMVMKLSEQIGNDPASVLISINVVQNSEGGEGELVEEELTIPLPTVSKAFTKKIPVLGSIRTKAGGGRIGEEATKFKQAGYTGAILRQDCIPQISMSQDLEYLSNFWSACIGDLKSTKSKSFEFRSKNNMYKDLGAQWAKYQMDVIQSGALGEDDSHSAMGGLNTDAGDYKGF